MTRLGLSDGNAFVTGCTRVVGPGAPFRSEEKRFPLPCAAVESACPQCGEVVREDQYISFPKLNQPEIMTFTHHRKRRDGSWEKHEWDVVIQIDVSLRILSEEHHRPRARHRLVPVGATLRKRREHGWAATRLRRRST